MLRTLVSLVFIMAVLVAGCSDAHAASQKVRVYLGAAAHGGTHHDVVIHRLYRPPYDPRNYRRVSRSDSAGGRGGGSTSGIAKPVRETTAQQTQVQPYQRHQTERSRRHHEWHHTMDRVVIIFVERAPEGPPAYLVERHLGGVGAPPPADP